MPKILIDYWNPRQWVGKNYEVAWNQQTFSIDSATDEVVAVASAFPALILHSNFTMNVIISAIVAALAPY